MNTDAQRKDTLVATTHTLWNMVGVATKINAKTTKALLHVFTYGNSTCLYIIHNR